MEIILAHIGKKFNRQWIFKNVSLRLSADTAYAITGPNGSGKSTFLSVLSGYMIPTEGDIHYSINGKKIQPEDFFSHVSIAAPYLELIEEYTLSELIDFHFQFIPFKPGENKKTLIQFVKLEHAVNKQIRHYSSGMKQRVKLGLALFSHKPILLLDEPTVNLDNDGIQWYKEMITHQVKNRITVISSNLYHEYDFAGQIIKIDDLK